MRRCDRGLDGVGRHPVGDRVDVGEDRLGADVETGLTVATNVSAGTITSSPGPTPAASSARCSAAVPETALTALSAPWNRAKSASNSLTKRPLDETQRSSMHCCR